MPDYNPKGSLDHLKKPTPPDGPIPLAYGQARYPSTQPPLSFGSQCFLGFICWVAAVVMAIGFLIVTRSNAVDDWLGRIGLLTELGGIITLAVWLRVKLKWRGFFPGLLIGLGLTCLVPIGIIAVVCSGHSL